MTKKNPAQEKSVENKEVAVKTEALPAVAQAAPQADWGDDEFTANDIRIAKIFPMQMTSKKVTEGEAAFGDLRDSITNELLGSLTSPLEFIPINVKKVSVESEWVDGNWKYKRTVPITRENENAPYEEEKNGVKLKRVRTLNALVILPRDIESGFPKLISFRVTSLAAGKDIVAQIQKNKLVPGGGNADKVMLLKGRKEKNNKGVFVVLEVQEGRVTSAQERERAFYWAKAFSGGKVKVHEAEDEAETGGGYEENISSGSSVPQGF